MFRNKRMQLVVLVLVSVSFVALSAWAEPRYDEHGDLIRPQAKLRVGVLQSIQSNRGQDGGLVIGDSGYSFDKETVFTTSYGNHSSLSIFRPGMTVNFYAVGQLLTKMWPSTVEMTEEDSAMPNQGESAGSQDGTLHLENGVWTN